MMKKLDISPFLRGVSVQLNGGEDNPIEDEDDGDDLVEEVEPFVDYLLRDIETNTTGLSKYLITIFHSFSKSRKFILNQIALKQMEN